MKRTKFIPKKHAFDFVNDFKNQVKALGFIKMETDGLCGGMSYAALDYYFANMRRPNAHPELNKYLIKRQLDSFTMKDSWKFFQWTRKSNSTISPKTLKNEIPKIKRNINKGKPVVIGLIGAKRIRDIGKDNHQVVCYGYGKNKNGHTELYVYDPNCPPTDSFSGEIVISPERTKGSGKDVPGDSAEPIKTETGSLHPHFRADRSKASKPDKIWRGLFVQNYKPKPNPPVIRDSSGDGRDGRVRDHRDGKVRDHRSRGGKSSGGTVVRDHRSGSKKKGSDPIVRDHRTKRK